MERKVSLFFTEGSSDKVYNAQLQETSGGWQVFFQYGRRGKPLTAGEKTAGPTTLEKANKIYDTLVGSKTKKGYTEQEDGAVFTSAEQAGRVTGFRPQLLNEVLREHTVSWTPENADSHAGWFVQEKHDGERRGVIAKDRTVTYANRNGLEVGVDARIDESMKKIASYNPEGFIFDGEDMGDHIVIFDVIYHPALAKDAPFHKRVAVLEAFNNLVSSDPSLSGVRVDVPEYAETFFRRGGPADLAQRGSEGYVLRHRNAAYEAGRPNSGGDALKIKFTESCTVRVIGINSGKRSVGMEVMDAQGDWVNVGNVTVPGTAPVTLKKGDIIEVKYLYAFKGGSLFQPVLKGPRSDVGAEACKMSQLKYKGQGLQVDAFDRPDLAEVYGLRVDTQAAFLAEAPESHIVRAERNAAGDQSLQGDAWSLVLWDPQDDDEGFMLVGNDEAELRAHFEDHARTHFDAPPVVLEEPAESTGPEM